MQISDIIPGVNIICGKVSVASVNGAGESVGVLKLQQGLYGTEHPKKIFRL